MIPMLMRILAVVTDDNHIDAAKNDVNQNGHDIFSRSSIDSNNNDTTVNAVLTPCLDNDKYSNKRLWGISCLMGERGRRAG